MAHEGWERAFLLSLWAMSWMMSFVARAMWHQHVSGFGRLCVNSTLLAGTAAIYVYQRWYDAGTYFSLYLLVGFVALAIVRYTLFTARRRRLETNAAGVLAGAFGCAVEEQTAQVKKWSGRNPKRLEANIPTKIKRSELPEVKAQIGQRLESPPGREWRTEFDMKRHLIALTSIAALPEMVRYEEQIQGLNLKWHEYAIAVSRSGLVIWDCLHLSHLLIAGATGGGKSVALLTTLMNALNKPSEWLIYAIDLKRVELTYLRGRSNAVSVATDLAAALAVVEAVCELMHRRYEEMEREGVNHFLLLPKRLYAVILVIDEFAELSSASGLRGREARAEDEQRASCVSAILSIARLGRAAGIHLVMATQRPDATILPGTLKVNVGARLAVGRLNGVSSDMVIENRSASELPEIKGRAMWRTSEGSEEVQVLFSDADTLDFFTSRRNTGEAAEA